jgi:hypothetical protein
MLHILIPKALRLLRHGIGQRSGVGNHKPGSAVGSRHFSHKPLIRFAALAHEPHRRLG